MPQRASSSPARRATPRKSAGTAGGGVGVNDGFGTGADRAWTSSPAPAKAEEAVPKEEAAATLAPPVLLTGPVLGGVVAVLAIFITPLYLFHDREAKEWDTTVPNAATCGHWPPPSADFNWCEPDYVYTDYVAELWNSLTSLNFCVGPVVLWRSTEGDWEARLNLLLLAAIGLGSAIFHATLQYEGQLLDELPMICYVGHTVTLLARKDSTCPSALKLAMLGLSVLLFSTPREAAAHKAGRVVMVLGFAACFLWLAFSLAAICARLDRAAPSSVGGGTKFFFTRRYQYLSLIVLCALVGWVADNVACKVLHSLPWGLPYLHLHATMWHTGMSFLCHSLCLVVIGTRGARGL